MAHNETNNRRRDGFRVQCAEPGLPSRGPGQVPREVLRRIEELGDDFVERLYERLDREAAERRNAAG